MTGEQPRESAAPARPARPGRTLAVTDLSLVVLIGATGSGKSTFAARHFKPTEVISSDFCRGLVSDDENDQTASRDAFDVLHYIAGKRLAAGRLTVVDATSVQSESRRQLIALAREHDVLPIAVVLDVPERICAERNAARPDRAGMPRHVVQRHQRELRRSLRHLEREGFRKVHVLRGPEEIDAAEIVRERRYNDLRHLTGPFDIIGDVHGCRSELETLLGRLGYALRYDEAGRPVGAAHPGGRTAVFVGDLVDRGPDSPGVLRLVMNMVEAGTALCVPGNHENKLGRYLKGRNVRVSHGLAETVAQMEKEDDAFRARVRAFIDGLVSHYVLDGGGLVVCHAGLPEKYHGRTSGRVRSHALYGETTGETDEFGLPVRYPWAEDYRGRAAVVYGHTPVPRTSWLNNTICLDTGCVFGGRMTALRWPERELVDVPAERVWYEPVKPLDSGAPGGAEGRPLDLGDVTGRRVIETRHHGRVAVREENAAAALEVMSRFALAPELVPYLPPTMAPCATSAEEGYLEHPAEAFAGYRADGVREVMCQEKHMGSRAVALVCRDAETAAERFGVPEGGVPGAICTRTGRPFLDDPELTRRILARLAECAETAGLWAELDTPWLLLDAELMPWSLKAAGLLRHQYAAVGAASRAVFPGVLDALEAAAARGAGAPGLLDRQRERLADAEAFTAAYRRYCWPVGDPARPWPGAAAESGDSGGADGADALAGAGGSGVRGEAETDGCRAGDGPGTDGLDGIRLAPFQLLAAEGRNLATEPHDIQLAWIDRLIEAEAAMAARRGAGRPAADTAAEGVRAPAATATGGPGGGAPSSGPRPARVNRLLHPTRRLLVDTADEASVAAGVRWWLELTGAGGEGMVVKPLRPLARDGRGRLVQPGVKVRGREYLRIVYGPEYTRPENLERLRARHLGHKRSLALREYALGLEALDRLAGGEPLWRVHEAVFAVLALESEPVDPRL
ncbi:MULTISPECIES: polynucleotide kinase-phosphatase [Streptomyces]|uniref:Polynucleotide kinase-phosphatase n=2 Tax=Streptomyces TaxID=1883 RepID=A0A3M8F5F9_9ACTN|nr:MULTISPECIES: polynucleotide kinase-phosphatase [Streptomyces]KNE84283.1 metallophosphoesterase [Streptomyces fradiae]OFA58932.1 polynucleotide kinase-phosphatase [Streptomyces fradiae]PQM22138.1 polynucleotide kinase-phosphatase [Streptomyces xinghaiensis]RKM95388.1 polynucleotide kinase-phosphatase [Streptomyces xinghaiensis]RNC72972.1 polynucleotide kinase-phosphatase [Streptomyces xinghaiensis]